MSMIMRCKGCGAALQTIEKDKVGYALSLDHEYCQSCYRLLHYGESSIHFHPEDLPSLPENSLILMISSVLHLDLLFSHPVWRYQSEAKFIYIINQIDLLPKDTNLEMLLQNIIKKAKSMQVPYEDIILMSAKNPFDIDHLKQYVQSFSSKHIYLLGVQNSGKTTLFKALTNDNKALAFKKAGLTQEALEGMFNDQKIIDMPGLYQSGYLHHLLPYTVYKRLIPDQEIHPKIYTLGKGQTVFIEGLVAVTLTTETQPVVFYLDRNIRMHKTNEKRIHELLENKEEQFKIYAEAYEEKAFRIRESKMQITLADMGFIHITGPCHLKIVYPKGFHLSLSEALFQ
jgi:30S ribosome assembly GTPase